MDLRLGVDPGVKVVEVVLAAGADGYPGHVLGDALIERAHGHAEVVGGVLAGEEAFHSVYPAAGPFRPSAR